MRITNPFGSPTFKKGKVVELSWTGGETDETFKVGLVREGVKLYNLENSVAGQNFYWSIPKNTKPGHYKLYLESNQDPAKTAVSGEFRIKNKTPFIIKILPVAALGAGAYFLFFNKSSDAGDPTISPLDELPAPPDPPN